MTDKHVRQDIIDELDFDPSVNAAHIGMAVDNGVVTSSGHVGSCAEKLAAERTVQRVKGGRSRRKLRSGIKTTRKSPTTKSPRERSIF